ncbi:MAG: hypothetical protein QXL16_00735 [Candidatus Micrarchaeaceae archaeon]
MASKSRVYTAIVVILILLLGLVAFIISSYQFPATIKSNESILLKFGKPFLFDFNKGTFIFIVMKNLSGDYLYFTKYPIGIAPIFAYPIQNGEELNISTSFSSYADISAKVTSLNLTYAKLNILVIPSFVRVGVTEGREIQPYLFMIGEKLRNITIVNATTSTTSTSSTSTSTTINFTEVNMEKALSLANSTLPGILMQKLSRLYINSKYCTPSIYNETFLIKLNKTPSGPFSFYNVSYVTPYGVNVTAEKGAGSVYSVIYTLITKDPSFSKPALIIVLNISSKYPIVNVTYTGAYMGLNYTLLNQTYNFESKINNQCAALIPYSP